MPAKVQEMKRAVGQVERASGFVREICSELRKVVWPTRQEAINLTLIVIGVCAAVGLFLGLVDFGFTEMFRIILQ